MPTRTSNNNDQVVYAQYVGCAPTAPSDIYEYNFATEPEAYVACAADGSRNSPLVTATPVGKIHAKNEAEHFADALNVPFKTPYGTSYSPPLRPTGNILTTSIATVSLTHPGNAITGNEVLRLMKKDRKRQTLSAGIVWGAVGFLILGPVGAVVLGGGLAITAKRSLKKQERTLREQFQNQGTLDQLVAIPVGLSRRQRRRILSCR